MADTNTLRGTGRRKTPSRGAHRRGRGKIVINDKPYDRYFVTKDQRVSVEQPLVALEARE
jgi:ribosomal protein S9